jgi:hypothetical protein
MRAKPLLAGGSVPAAMTTEAVGGWNAGYDGPSPVAAAAAATDEIGHGQYQLID